MKLKILYVGKEEKGAVVVNPVAEEFCYGVDYTGFISTSERFISNVLGSINRYGVAIIDVEELTYSKEQIIVDISKILNSGYKGRIIIKAMGYSLTSDLISGLVMAGVSYGIMSLDITEARQELKNALEGKSNFNKQQIIDNPLIRTPIINPNIESNKPVLPQNKPCKLVGIAGAGNRIGTTTQAFLMTRFLLSVGIKACYVQFNNSKFIESLANVYDNISIDTNIGKISYDGIDMFYDYKKITEILKLDYDYYICDYGNILLDSFELASFEEKNIKILVAGSKPNEILLLDKAIDKLYQKNINYIFSFTAENDKPDILEYMDTEANHCYFADYSPDMFMLNDKIQNYEKIFSIIPVTNSINNTTENETENKKEKKKKKGFFWRK